jgi:hypothetical protein
LDIVQCVKGRYFSICRDVSFVLNCSWHLRTNGIQNINEILLILLFVCRRFLGRVTRSKTRKPQQCTPSRTQSPPKSSPRLFLRNFQRRNLQIRPLRIIRHRESCLLLLHIRHIRFLPPRLSPLVMRRIPRPQWIRTTPPPIPLNLLIQIPRFMA